MANHRGLECSRCHRKLSLNEYITCKQCNQKFHYDCVDLPEHLRPMMKEVKNYFTWFCEACKKPSTPSPNIQPNIRPVMLPANIYRPVMLPANIYRPVMLLPSHNDALKKVVHRSKSFAKSEVGESGTYISTASPDGYEVHLPINDYFVELELEERKELRFRRTRQKIYLSEIFQRSENREGFRNSCILITAEAGFGKSTLVKKLNHDWATLDRPNYISHFDIIVNTSLRQTQNQPVEEMILHDIFCKIVPSRRLRHSMSRTSRILVILDGLDEIDKRSNAIEFLKDHKRILENITENYSIIVTSRPYVVIEILHLFDKHISILGLSSLRTYALKIVLPKPKTENLLRNIAKDRLLRDISKCPLMFHILCCVYRNDSSLVATTRTELYLQILNLLIKSYEKKHGVSYSSAPLTKKTIIEDKVFVRLGRIAWDFLRNPDPITEKELMEQLEKDTELKFVLGLSILVPDPTIFNKEVVTTYKFLYCSFIEFLASVYLLNEIKTPESREIINETLLTYKEMLKPGFVVGLLGRGIFNHKNLLQWLTKKSQTLSELNEIKNEACLDEDSWKSFCKEVKKLKCSHLDDDQILNFEIALPNLSEIRIVFFQNNMQRDFVHKLINKFNTIYHLVISLSLRLPRLKVDEDSDITLHFLDMRGIMSELISIEKILSSNRRHFVVSVIVYKESRLHKTTKGEEESTFGRITTKISSRKKDKPVGLLAKLLPLLKCTTDQRFLWKIGNIEIEYKIGDECNSSKDIPFPIIVITTEEYDIIGEEPFSHEAGLKIMGFGDAGGNAKIPKMFGHVRSSKFFERFNKHRSKALASFLDNPEEEYVGKMINSLLITHPPELTRKPSILQAI